MPILMSITSIGRWAHYEVCLGPISLCWSYHDALLFTMLSTTWDIWDHMFQFKVAQLFFWTCTDLQSHNFIWCSNNLSWDYMHAYTHTYIHTYIYTCVFIHFLDLYTCVIYIYICVCKYICIYLFIYLHTYWFIYIYICIYIYIDLLIYIFWSAHIFTYIQIDNFYFFRYAPHILCFLHTYIHTYIH